MTNYPNTKKFWKENIRKKKDKHNFTDDEITPTRDWGKQIDNATTFKQLDELGRKFRKHMYSQKWMLSSLKDFGGEPNEEKEYYNHLLQDLVTQESKINSLETENTSLKTSDTAHENSIKDFQNKLKAIIGDDLTTWETKIVKKDGSNQQVADLQTKINSLITEKDKLTKQVKEKEDQWVNHKCDTPNNAELNQVKEELKNANQEKDRLQTELNKKNKNIPIPQPKEEEDKKEEQENQKLTVEELREKLTSKQQEIRDLQEQLSKMNNSQSNQDSKQNPKFLLGIMTASLIMLIAGGMAYLVKYRKKKKKTNKFHLIKF